MARVAGRNTRDVDELDRVTERLMAAHDTSHVSVYSTSDEASKASEEEYIGYYANSRSVGATALEYLQDQGFTITFAGVSYLERIEGMALPHRAGRRVGYVGARRRLAADEGEGDPGEVR